ncbi:MAG: DUF4157 domain-containing protein, partial [Bacteroidota bacterium]
MSEKIYQLRNATDSRVIRHTSDTTTPTIQDTRPEAIQLQQTQTALQTQSPAPIQRQENKTGLPDQMKTNLEAMSGFDMSDVRVHRNSSKPAQLQAHAYAQGTDIHLGPGQEKHLGHEAWHVVQQKQGRVRPTMQMKGNININDNVYLEKEADVIGTKILNNTFSYSHISSREIPAQRKIIQCISYAKGRISSDSWQGYVDDWRNEEAKELWGRIEEKYNSTLKKEKILSSRLTSFDDENTEAIKQNLAVVKKALDDLEKQPIPFQNGDALEKDLDLTGFILDEIEFSLQSLEKDNNEKDGSNDDSSKVIGPLSIAVFAAYLWFADYANKSDGKART